MKEKNIFNVVLVIILVLAISFAVYAYIKFDNKNKQE